MKTKFDHSGSTFDSFLEEEGIRDEVEATAVKRVVAWQLQQAMLQQGKSKLAMAKDLRTSRTQIDRLLDPANTAVSIYTIARAAHALGKTIEITIKDPKGPGRKRRESIGLAG
jgi:antitoxin HicB